jgi:hypothetical protein
MRCVILSLAAAVVAVLLCVAAPAPAAGMHGGQAVQAPALMGAVADAPADSPYVRLRGCPEIHLRTCEKVKRADPAGIVPANKNDGPPCWVCRRSEVK